MTSFARTAQSLAIATLVAAAQPVLPAVAQTDDARRSGGFFYAGAHAGYMFGNARATLADPIGIGSQSAEFADLLKSGAGIWNLGLGIAAPLFDAGRREARVDQATARREQAVAGYQRSVETAFREVADALVNVERSTSSEAELQLRLQAAGSALDLSNERYRSGYSPFLEVLDAQRTVNDAAIAFVRNRQARLAFNVDLMKALGGGWNSGSDPEFKKP